MTWWEWLIIGFAIGTVFDFVTVVFLVIYVAKHPDALTKLMKRSMAKRKNNHASISDRKESL